MNIQIIKNAVKVNHCLSRQGTGLFPANADWEDSVHSANAMFIWLAKRFGVEEKDIISELGVTYQEYQSIFAFMKYCTAPLPVGAQMSDERVRFYTKLKLCQNYLSSNWIPVRLPGPINFAS
jgi:hypothetical protein